MYEGDNSDFGGRLKAGEKKRPMVDESLLISQRYMRGRMCVSVLKN